MVITFSSVSFEYATKTILKEASFSLTDNSKIGVVGINGVGKTTLIKLITKEEKPNNGEIIISGGTIINVLKQEPEFIKGESIYEYVMKGSTKEHPIDSFEAKSILTKLGFSSLDSDTSTMSGGEKKKVALARVMVEYSDLLILDEPTNHLDVETICFLEKFLMRYKKSILLITHDRYFLERICNKILEIDFGKTYMYDASYSLFLEEKALRIEREEASKRKLANLLKRETEWMHKGAEARSTKQKARIERFNELEKISFNDRSSTIKFDSVNTRLGKKLIEIKNGGKVYLDKTLFNNFNFMLNRHDIIGVVGENGAGKSTLFKILNGSEELSSGELIKGETLKIGYLSQHLDLVDPEMKIIDYINQDRQLIETTTGVINSAQLLERFLFDRNIQQTKIKLLSGGEKRRLQIVKVLSNNPNMLLLDEPTNDLDIYTLEVLEDYLLDFNGPILTISHDRYFLDKICSKLLIFDNKVIKESNSSFSEYLENKKDDEKEINNTYQEKKNKDKEKFYLNREYKTLNEEINALDNKLKDLKNELSSQTTDYVYMVKLQSEIDELNKTIEEKLERSFEIEELLKD